MEIILAGLFKGVFFLAVLYVLIGLLVGLYVVRFKSPHWHTRNRGRKVRRLIYAWPAYFFKRGFKL
jgi:hypothetical protein